MKSCLAFAAGLHLMGAAMSADQGRTNAVMLYMLGVVAFGGLWAWLDKRDAIEAAAKGEQQ